MMSLQRSKAVNFSDIQGFGIQVPGNAKLLNCKDLKEQLVMLKEKEKDQDIPIIDEAFQPFRNELRRYRDISQDLEIYHIDKINWSIPTQKEISPVTDKGISEIKNLIITKSKLAHKEGPMAEGTLFSPYMGSISSTSGCATCNLPNCHGHTGRILFPVLIPYYQYIDVVITILTCTCAICDRLILNEDTIRSMEIPANAKRSVRIAMIARESAKLSCIHENRSKGGKCGSRREYKKEKSKESGFFEFEDKVAKIMDKMSADQVDTHFRNLSVNDRKLLGFDDVETLCAYLCIGVIVPPIEDRPYIESFDKFKNPDNEQLSKIVAANEKLKEAIKKNKQFAAYHTDDSGNFSLKTEKELEISKRNLISQSEKTENFFSSQIAIWKNDILRGEEALRNDPARKDAENAINNAMTEISSIQEYLRSASPQEALPANARLQELNNLIGQASTFLRENDMQKRITEMRNLIKTAEVESEKKSQEYGKQIESIINREKALVNATSIDTNNGDIAKLVNDLYTAHMAYIKLVLKKPTGKRENLRRNALGKNALHVGRAVASPGVDLEIGEIEIPFHLAPSLGVTEEITSLNIAEYQMMAIPPSGQNRKISYIHRNGEDIEVTNLALQEGKLVLRVGDIVTRHLRDGDVVVAVRMPTIHRNNMLAFRAKIVQGSYSIRVHMVWTTGYNLDFDGDEISLYVPESEAIPEVMASMYAPLNLISPRTSKLIGGVVYNAVSAWYIATKTKRIVSDTTWDGVYLRLTGRHQLPSFFHRLAMRGITMKTGAALFSMLLPESFNYPSSGDEPVDGVIIESGILIAGTLTSAHLSPGESRTIIQAIYTMYGTKTTEEFLNDIYMAAYLIQRDIGQTITAEDCAYGTQTIVKIPNAVEYESVKNKIDKEVGRGNILTVVEYMDRIMEIEKVDRDTAKNKAELIVIEKYIQAMGPIPEDKIDAYVARYIELVKDVRNFSTEAAETFVKSFVIGKASEIEGKKKLEVAQTKIRLLPGPDSDINKKAFENKVYDALNNRVRGDLVENVLIYVQSRPLPKNVHEKRHYETQILSILNVEGNNGLDMIIKSLVLDIPLHGGVMEKKAYDKQLLNIIDEMGNVGEDAALEIAKFMGNNLFDMASRFGAGAKGNPGNIAMMGGFIGQQQIKGSARIPSMITGNTRCLTSIRPGSTDLQAGGYIDNNYFSGMSSANTFLGAVGQREGMSDTVTKTATAGEFNRLACKAMENLVILNGSVRSQNGQLYQYLYGEDGFDAKKLLYVNGKVTFVNIPEVADKINYQAGWERRTVLDEADVMDKILRDVEVKQMEYENVRTQTVELLQTLQGKIQNIEIRIVQSAKSWQLSHAISEKEKISKKLEELQAEYDRPVSAQEVKRIAEREVNMRADLADARARIKSLSESERNDDEWEREFEMASRNLAEKLEAFNIRDDIDRKTRNEMRDRIQLLDRELIIAQNKVREEIVKEIEMSEFRDEYFKLSREITEIENHQRNAKYYMNEAIRNKNEALDNAIHFPMYYNTDNVSDLKQYDLAMKNGGGENIMRQPWFLRPYEK